MLIVAADSWRFDRLGVHGSTRRDLTPNLDAFAATAVDFRAHHVATASTLESWTTMLTGQFPPRHGLRSMYPSREEVRAVETSPLLLPKLLEKAFAWSGNYLASNPQVTGWKRTLLDIPNPSWSQGVAFILFGFGALTYAKHPEGVIEHQTTAAIGRTLRMVDRLKHRSPGTTASMARGEVTT